MDTLQVIFNNLFVEFDGNLWMTLEHNLAPLGGMRCRLDAC